MIKFIKSHEDFVHHSLEDPTVDLDWLLLNHRDWIEFLQHERLVHLLVTLMVTLLFLIFFGLSLFFKSVPYLAVFFISTILLLFYVVHYYKLENSVQRWYSIYDSIVKKKLQRMSQGIE